MGREFEKVGNPCLDASDAPFPLFEVTCGVFVSRRRLVVWCMVGFIPSGGCDVWSACDDDSV